MNNIRRKIRRTNVIYLKEVKTATNDSNKNKSNIQLISKLIPAFSLIMYAYGIIGYLSFYPEFYDINILNYVSLTEILIDSALYIIPVIIVELLIIGIWLCILQSMNKSITAKKYIVHSSIFYLICLFVTSLFIDKHIVNAYISPYLYFLLLGLRPLIIAYVFIISRFKNGIKIVIGVLSIIVSLWAFIWTFGLNKTAVRDFNVKYSEIILILEDGSEILSSPNSSWHIIGETKSAYFLSGYDNHFDGKNQSETRILYKENVKEVYINVLFRHNKRIEEKPLKYHD